MGWANHVSPLLTGFCGLNEAMYIMARELRIEGKDEFYTRSIAVIGGSRQSAQRGEDSFRDCGDRAV